MSKVEEPIASDEPFPPASNVRIIDDSEQDTSALHSGSAHIAALLDRAGDVEAPEHEGFDEPVVVVHPRGDGSGPERLKQETLNALERAEKSHREALEHSDECWRVTHEAEERFEAAAEEEAAAVAVLELVREKRRSAEREARRARHEAEAASERILVTSRALEDARHRAARR
jgi:hypothetical protein